MAVGRDDPRLARLDARRPLMARTSQSFERAVGDSDLPGPFLVFDRATGDVFGVANAFRPGPHSGLVELTLFLDPTVPRPGWGVEAYLLYARHMLDRGHGRLSMTLLGGDHVGLRMLGKLELLPTARLREHEWNAGCYHDAVVYVVSRERFAAVDSVLTRLLGGPAPEPVLSGSAT